MKWFGAIVLAVILGYAYLLGIDYFFNGRRSIIGMVSE